MVIANGPLITKNNITYKAVFTDSGDTGTDLRYYLYIESSMPLDRTRTYMGVCFYKDEFLAASKHFVELIQMTIAIYEDKASL